MNTRLGKNTVLWRRTRTRASLSAFLMVLPQLIGFLLFSLYPILWVLSLAFYKYDMVTMKFCGLDNFIRIFGSDLTYWKSVVNTFEISFIKLIVEIPLSLIVAVILKDVAKRGSSLFRTAFFLPNVISTAIIGVVFSFIFASYNGIANNIMQFFHIISAPVDWFSQKWTAMLVIMIASIWQGFGINMLYFLTGLVGIPQEIYESADLDGANAPQKFIKITVPMLGSVLKIVIMLAIIGSIQMSDLVLVLTNGQPAGETEVVMTYIFKQLFAMVGDSSGLAQAGYASALGIVTAVILSVVTLIYNRASSGLDHNKS